PDGVRRGGQHMQPPPLLSQHVRRGLSCLPVRPLVHSYVESLCRRAQLTEGRILVEQVGGGGHQIPLGDLHRRLDPPFGLGVIGPSPQSNWHHMPGSGTQGRCVRRCPAAQHCLASATARRVVRSSPPKPIATIRSCATSARTLPPERSTSSSIFSKNGSISRR